MKFLSRLIQEAVPVGPTAVRLTDTQKNVLVSVYAAATPELAYNYTIGAENVVQAREQLHNMGLISINDAQARAGITDEGQTALANVNYIDDVGQLTDEGDAALAQQDAIRREFESATESVQYGILKQLI